MVLTSNPIFYTPSGEVGHRREVRHPSSNMPFWLPDFPSFMQSGRLVPITLSKLEHAILEPLKLAYGSCMPSWPGPIFPKGGKCYREIWPSTIFLRLKHANLAPSSQIRLTARLYHWPICPWWIEVHRRFYIPRFFLMSGCRIVFFSTTV